MSATKILLDKYRETCLPPNDNGMAKRLGVSRAAVSRWVNGVGHPNPEAIEQMAKELGEVTGPWLAQIEAERARTPSDKRVWLRLAATLGTALALTMTALPHAAAAMWNWLPIVSNYTRHLIRKISARGHDHTERYSQDSATTHPFERHSANPAFA